ncbi:MAG: hypothetical protein ACM3RX_05990 [Methanococcaceae archaeon]
MKNVPNEINADLLLNNPQKFVVENQKVIEIIVGRYVKAGYISFYNKDEMIQHINLRLLDGVISKMQIQYNPTYFVSTYFASVVNNLCKEFLNIQRKEDENVNFEDFAKNKASKSNPNYSLIIDEEIDRLDMIFRLYRHKKEKLFTSLKIKFKIEITRDDIARLQKEADFDSDHLEFSHSFMDDKTESELFNYYAPIFEKSNGKPVSGDSLKRWTYQKIEEVIDLLNGRENKKLYDIETLSILFEKYAQKKSNSGQNLYIYN